MANSKKQVESENDSTTENTAIENNTGAENTAAPAEENIKIIDKYLSIKAT